MAKRRISKQQSTRIAKIQANYRDISSDETGNTEEALVITRFKKHAIIETTAGKLVHCSIRPNIESLVAGDKVVFQMETEEQGIILSCYPRETLLSRTNKRGEFRAVAANLSQLMIVIAAKPEVSWPLLDSYLVMAELLNLKACIVLNKIDLPCDFIKDDLLAIYTPLDYDILFLSKEQPNNFKALENKLKNETSVFVGQSGVGKSSLIAKILPHENNIAVGAISDLSELGKHTTSNSKLYHLPTGGRLIDSPGVREFSLIHLPSIELIKGYPELSKLQEYCKFRNCNHLNSPGCAILKALDENTISAKRYDNYVKLAYP
ncbi:MAG: ribosome small subunit-dependent GTPase A [Proteobacteria bacterium]|nr:ribosome small subunit-dependent GTPase A [Pseudomonadota bacterium]